MRPIFVASLYFAIVNMTIATDAVIWKQEIGFDANSTYRPGAIGVDSVGNEVIIMGMSEQAGTKEANLWLWKIDSNGSVTHKKSVEPVSKYTLFMMKSFGIRATVKPMTGDIVGLNMDDANGVSLFVTDRNMRFRTAKMNSGKNWTKDILLHDMTSCANDNLLFVGKDSNSDGIVIKTDLDGNMVWKKTFDIGQTEILSSIACDSDGDKFYVVGLSASMASKMTFAGPATVCVLRYDGNGELKASTYIEGGLAPWPTSFPKVIFLPSGIVLVVYDKSGNGKVTELYVKAYTVDLEPLYEKQILKTEEDAPPAFYDICATNENRFVFAGGINFEDLILYECEAGGEILQTLELDDEIGAVGVYVDYLPGKIFVAFASKSQEGTKNAKIKLLALKPYKTN